MPPKARLPGVFILIMLMVQACTEQLDSIENYHDARIIFWDKIYPQAGKTLYCGKPFETKYRRGINVEHVFPMSWVTNSLKCGTRKQCRESDNQFNRIEADLHNLYPARSDINKARSSYRFGEVRGEQRRFGNRCDFEVNEQARVAEPSPVIRGDVARVMFYMADMYRDQGLILFEKQARLLHDWHQQDPPNLSEVRRNDLIEKQQGNRNRFVDQPELLTELFRADYFKASLINDR